MRFAKTILVLASAVPLLLSTIAGGAQTNPAADGSIQQFQYKSALRASQDAIGHTLSSHRFTDSSGQSVSLASLRGKPLVLSLVYTSCYQICPTTTRHLAGVVEKARTTLGQDAFSVAVLGFDAQFDGPLAMAQFARQQGIDDAGWYVLSADQDTVNALAKELGFVFFTSPNGFDHVVQASVIDAEGTLYRQVYGEVFDTPLLIEPLLDLVLARPKPDQSLFDDLIDKVRFFCTTYDPARDAYSFDYSLFIGMLIGGVIIVCTAGFIWREYRRGQRRVTV